jgi:GxxExxY protein
MEHENTKVGTVKHDDTNSDPTNLQQAKSASTAAADLGRRAVHSMRLKSPLPEKEEEILHRTIGCGLRVHRELGPGFLEIVYRRAVCIELSTQQIPFQTEVPVNVTYANRIVGVHRIDLLIGGVAVLELKAVERLDLAHKAQVLSYLRATGLRAGLLLNFGTAPLTVRRVLL